MVLMLTADHGPTASGATNTIVASHAGKDLISSLVSGLLAIGSRFGGALNETASMFSDVRDIGLTPRQFVDGSRNAINSIKSVNNPDPRVELVNEYMGRYPRVTCCSAVRSLSKKVTTAKKDAPILNVDGCIAVCFVDLLCDSGVFNREEADEYFKIGTLNGLVVLASALLAIISACCHFAPS
ncbi:citrate synthase [Ceratobasidium sp. 394]|nr:citrate synthase [Ceratobasidium sp. 394]